jgi:hypothetical protein
MITVPNISTLEAQTLSKFTIEQATKAQRRGRGIDLLFL